MKQYELDDDRVYDFPNLRRFIAAHEYHYSTFADFAEVSNEVMEAYMEGRGGLSLDEMGRCLSYSLQESERAKFFRIALLDEIVYLNPNNRKHRIMADFVKQLVEYMEPYRDYIRLVDSYLKNNAECYAKWYEYFEQGLATYSGWLARVEALKDFIQINIASVISPTPKRTEIRF